MTLTFRSSSILNMPGISVHSGRDRIMTGGKERTAKRFELPLVAADLQFLRVIPTIYRRSSSKLNPTSQRLKYLKTEFRRFLNWKDISRALRESPRALR